MTSSVSLVLAVLAVADAGTGPDAGVSRCTPAPVAVVQPELDRIPEGPCLESR